MLKDEIEKKIHEKKRKNKPEFTWVNSPNPWLGPWDKDNLIERKSKQTIKLNSQNIMLNDEIKKKINYKKKKKIGVN
jgi:hypothetical protein